MKKLLVGLSCLLLLVVLAFPVLAANQSRKSVTAPPEIEKITFVHHAKSGHSKPTWDETQEDFRLIAGGVKWPTTMSYEVNPSGSGLGSELVRSTLEASSETWDDETLFELFALPTLTGETSVGYDETNRVVWGALDPGVIAVNYIWYRPSTKEIVESDTVFNDYYTWSTTGAGGAMDLKNIATHEFGHNGLNDLRPPKDWALTMYAYSALGEVDKQSLGTGDILGIQKLYGE